MQSPDQLTGVLLLRKRKVQRFSLLGHEWRECSLRFNPQQSIIYERGTIGAADDIHPEVPMVDLQEVLKITHSVLTSGNKVMRGLSPKKRSSKKTKSSENAADNPPDSPHHNSSSSSPSPTTSESGTSYIFCVRMEMKSKDVLTLGCRNQEEFDRWFDAIVHALKRKKSILKTTSCIPPSSPPAPETSGVQRALDFDGAEKKKAEMAIKRSSIVGAGWEDIRSSQFVSSEGHILEKDSDDESDDDGEGGTGFQTEAALVTAIVLKERDAEEAAKKRTPTSLVSSVLTAPKTQQPAATLKTKTQSGPIARRTSWTARGIRSRSSSSASAPKLLVKIPFCRKLFSEFHKTHYMIYCIQLTFGAMEWQVFRRYSQFDRLHKQLKVLSTKGAVAVQLSKLPHLTGKKRWRVRTQDAFEEKFIEYRRRRLEGYLRAIAGMEVLMSNVEVMSFLGLVNTDIHKVKFLPSFLPSFSSSSFP
jgi:hypothetical protein